MESRCPHCNALIEGKTDVCPLCRAEIKNEGERAYPPRAKLGKKYNVSFTLYYILSAMIVTLVAAVINVYLHPALQWWISSALSFVFIYYFIRHTILGIRNFASKLIYVTFATMSFIYSFRAIFNVDLIIDVVPYFALAFNVAVHVYVFATFNKSKGHLLALIIGDVACFIPLVIAAITRNALVAPIVVASIGVISATVTFSVFFKEIVAEIKRFIAF